MKKLLLFFGLVRKKDVKNWAESWINFTTIQNGAKKGICRNEYFRGQHYLAHYLKTDCEKNVL